MKLIIFSIEEWQLRKWLLIIAIDVCFVYMKCSNWFAFRSFDKGLQYTKRTSHYTNPQSVRKVLEYP